MSDERPAVAPTGEPQPAPTTGWTTPIPARTEVAPGLVFSDTASRFVAYLIDLLLIGIVAGIIGEALGWTGSQYPAGTAPTDWEQVFAMRPEVSVLTVVLNALYFVTCWSGGRRATLGQLIFSIQVGNAFDGRPLRLDQAVRRWLGLGDFVQVMAFTPTLVVALGSLVFLWNIVLLITTASSPTKQGVHDRLANSAVVRPTTAGTGLAYGCLALVIGLIVLTVVALIALIGLGAQVSSILSQVGESV
jgi:uncharacterized RDD family membrane protein YckC